MAPFNALGERRCLYGQATTIQLNFRPAFCPEHAIAGQKVAILRLNMQIDIKTR
ncbi:Uncharacterised protein [Escherichia coli]|uniref:Uncharacterized protein n=1 Tax=Escherichia coli TaxID=562 RepID=A0A377CGB4_ECOLX|nr:Uncharacterised protein [Escherichia coli]